MSNKKQSSQVKNIKPFQFNLLSLPGEISQSMKITTPKNNATNQELPNFMKNSVIINKLPDIKEFDFVDQRAKDLIDFDDDDMQMRDEESEETSVKSKPYAIEESSRFNHLEQRIDFMEVKKMDAGDSPKTDNLRESQKKSP